jgi:Flp pilus assembly protein TadD
MMFGFEPVAKSPESQQVVETGYSPTVEEGIIVVAEPDHLTMEEREAVPPTALTVSELVVEKEAAPVNVPPAQMTPVEKTSEVKPIAIKPAPSLVKASGSTASRHKKETVTTRVAKMTEPVLNRTVQTPAKVVVKTPVRMHPDDLPGAILSSSHTLIETKSIVIRPSKSQATSPFGRAEEAYLDGKWALAQDRSNLAVGSLQSALELYPGHLPARELLVETLGKEGKTGEAMFLLAEGLEIAPDYIVFKKKYARLLMDQGDYDAATKVMLNGGLPTVEEDPEAHVVLAALYQRLGESFLAAQTYRNLLVAWPQTGAFWVGLGGTLEEQHLSEEAVVCYQRALKTKGLRQDLSQYAQKRLSLLD